MNPFVSRINNQPWVWPVSGMCLVLGFMVSMAWVTGENRSTRMGFLAADQARRINEGTIDIEKFEELRAEVNRLQAKATDLENALGKQSGQAKLLNENLQETKEFAGLTEVEGPGLRVILKDDPNAQKDIEMGAILANNGIIHDSDVLRVVNELFSGGAEAIAVDGIRVAAGSSFRCVGPTILVNDMKIAAPVTIEAIGDSKELFGGMNLPGGVLSEIRSQNPAMVELETFKQIRLPAFAGKMTKRFARAPKEKPKDETK
ncbi:MAG TPA: DUF881 domain-containing protein [Fimbriimonas sp.]